MTEPTHDAVIDLQEQAKTEGAENPAFETGETTAENTPDTEGPPELPPFTYIDFAPQCLGSNIEGKEPDFDTFGSVVEQANQWLLSMPQFSAYKCETLTLRLGPDFKPDNDQTLTHVSSNGKNVYVRVLRVWLVPRLEPGSPVQQLAYITVLPDHSSGDLKAFLSTLASQPSPRIGSGDPGFPSFDRLTTTLDKLNKHLGVKPLPGKILSAETLRFKCKESNTTDRLDTEACSWSEGGANTKLYLHALRLFYVLGQPAYESLGYHDELPEILQSQEGLGVKIKFSNFSVLTAKAGRWLQQQQGVRTVNIQSVNCKLERKSGTGPWLLDPEAPGYAVGQSLAESRYTKILRVMYVKESRQDGPSPYASITLTSRIFAPVRISGKQFESFSKTVLRVIKWLNATRLPVFACETVPYQVNAEGEGQGFNEERPDYLVNSYSGRYYLTCIRLYFPSVFQEPPEEIEEDVEVAWGWRCVVS